MNVIQPFHVAFPVRDLKSTKEFYTTVLGCSVGRTSDHWIDFNLFGHQVVAHLSPNEAKIVDTGDVDEKKVPVRHFGVILEWDQWHRFADKLKANNVQFMIEPYIRFKGEVGEQATMFLLDPSDNALEFKSFKDQSFIFKK
ncbi:MAG: VOC family protein [Candidatus Neomarinimicrobiota bacterium]|nr:VOC family protein [Candidatus Neomarinimicrobiota bacterium]MEC9006770.1 VOC family protein [Candidatus Neomarinimicrobiota bacterium]MEC9475343.1 VOC family protein [Candidatus Neomarinimicrobiota bacterium]MED5247796.1 VOC family protein [Candidatus Neomarinimicrobiota bacterium]MED5433363.1 VOC family protein [Candidatus Neomarinimicrobiota bacterium]|tara:strand:+ start:5205 stop:5627 length:423 start_codon:yes stop_codon:yes gene_type:complete